MLMLTLVHSFHSFFAGFAHFVAEVPQDANTQLSKKVKDTIAGPILNSAEFLIPGAIALSGIHKLMEHRESGGAFLVELLVKGGGAVLVIQLVKTMIPNFT